MRKHGCHNKPRSNQPLLVQDGWTEPRAEQHGNAVRLVRSPVVRTIPQAFDVTLCKHDIRLTDPGCTDCKHAK